MQPEEVEKLLSENITPVYINSTVKAFLYGQYVYDGVIRGTDLTGNFVVLNAQDMKDFNQWRVYSNACKDFYHFVDDLLYTWIHSKSEIKDIILYDHIVHLNLEQQNDYLSWVEDLKY